MRLLSSQHEVFSWAVFITQPPKSDRRSSDHPRAGDWGNIYHIWLENKHNLCYHVTSREQSRKVTKWGHRQKKWYLAEKMNGAVEFRIVDPTSEPYWIEFILRISQYRPYRQDWFHVRLPDFKKFVNTILRTGLQKFALRSRVFVALLGLGEAGAFVHFRLWLLWQFWTFYSSYF